MTAAAPNGATAATEPRRLIAAFASVPPAPHNSPEAARRLFRAGVSIIGTQAEAYLRARGITGRLDWPSLRFHPALWYRPDASAPRESWPGLLAAVTDPAGRITGVHPTGSIARVPTRRRLPIRAGRSAICSATACASPPSRVPPSPTCCSPAKASRPCCRSNPCCPACR